MLSFISDAQFGRRKYILLLAIHSKNTAFCNICFHFAFCQILRSSILFTYPGSELLFLSRSSTPLVTKAGTH